VTSSSRHKIFRVEVAIATLFVKRGLRKCHAHLHHITNAFQKFQVNRGRNVEVVCVTRILELNKGQLLRKMTF